MMLAIMVLAMEILYSLVLLGLGGAAVFGLCYAVWHTIKNSRKGYGRRRRS